MSLLNRCLIVCLQSNQFTMLTQQTLYVTKVHDENDGPKKYQCPNDSKYYELIHWQFLWE